MCLTNKKIEGSESNILVSPPSLRRTYWTSAVFDCRFSTKSPPSSARWVFSPRCRYHRFRLWTVQPPPDPPAVPGSPAHSGGCPARRAGSTLPGKHGSRRELCWDFLRTFRSFSESCRF